MPSRSRIDFNHDCDCALLHTTILPTDSLPPPLDRRANNASPCMSKPNSALAVPGIESRSSVCNLQQTCAWTKAYCLGLLSHCGFKIHLLISLPFNFCSKLGYSSYDVQGQFQKVGSGNPRYKHEVCLASTRCDMPRFDSKSDDKDRSSSDRPNHTHSW